MMKLARKLSVLFVVFVMVLSTFSFSSVLADNETNVLTAESGTYTADKTKPYDGNWNIVRWLTDRPDTYLDSATGKYVMQPKFKQEFAFIVGGVAEGSSITNFKLDISKWIDENKNTLQIYATDYIDSLNSEWTKLTWTKSAESGADDTKNNISIASCDNIPKVRGYRYIKIVVSSTRTKDFTWQDCISGFSFSWVKNDVGGESGTYKTDIEKPFDGNWHIISWETAKPADSMWSYGGNHAMESDNEFIYVTGGAPEGSAITNFSIDVTTDINIKPIVDIYASDSLNGTWTNILYTNSDISFNDVGVANNNKVAKKIDLSFDKSLGYRYIKIKKNANSSGGSWQWMIGGFSFKWEKNEFSQAAGTYTADIEKPFDGNWHIISWETAKPEYVVWDYNGKNAMQSDNEFVYVTGGAPEGSAITNFTIDLTWYFSDTNKKLQIYASDSLNGPWTELTYANTDLTPNNRSVQGNNLTNKLTLSLDKNSGYRYIKIKKNANSSGDSWKWLLGGFSFTWEGIPAVTVDYAKEDSTLKATVKLINQTDFSPFVAFAGYDSDNNLVGVSYHQESVLTGSRKIEYEIPAVGVAKARVYVWNYSDLKPFAVLDDFIMASAAE